MEREGGREWRSRGEREGGTCVSVVVLEGADSDEGQERYNYKKKKDRKSSERFKRKKRERNAREIVISAKLRTISESSEKNKLKYSKKNIVTFNSNCFKLSVCTFSCTVRAKAFSLCIRN